ncbi:hypothetical protein LCGC14_3048510 [marine sediment metagenome]|uniref:Uncharacterized protein n=1 Tax=marine sediment metagenome TaxID=412755 RepID=A0A0F8WMD0_9ZZZZ
MGMTLPAEKGMDSRLQSTVKCGGIMKNTGIVVVIVLLWLGCFQLGQIIGQVFNGLISTVR